MAVNPYSSQSISGYNSTPPPDDGSQTSANKVEWAKHKEKIGDPLKNLAEAINAQAVSAINTIALEDWAIHTTTATIAETDWHNGVLMTASGRVNYPDPSTLENGWHNMVYNGATSFVLLEATATTSFRRMSDGQTASGHTMLPGEFLKVYNTSTAFLIQGVRQQVYLGNSYAFETAFVTATQTIPFDDTAPQATEGREVLILSYSPVEVGNLLEVEGRIWAAAATGGWLGAIFQNATGDGGTATLPAAGIDAIAAGGTNLNAVAGGGSLLSDQTLHTWVTSTATTAQKFSLRFGGGTGNAYLHGHVGGSRTLGGKVMTWLKVTEYEL